MNLNMKNKFKYIGIYIEIRSNQKNLQQYIKILIIISKVIILIKLQAKSRYLQHTAES
jgi:hypothetical protein